MAGAGSLGELVVRSVAKQLRSAGRSVALGHDALRGPAAIHDARQRLKRLRAVLHLLRLTLGERTYRLEADTLRDAGRHLAARREAQVMRKTLSQLLDANTSPALRQEMLAALPAAVDVGLDLSAAAERIAASLQRSESWLQHPLRRAQLLAGFSRMYRRARRRLAAVRARPDTENCHELRKCVKYLWCQRRLLRQVCPGALRGRPRAKRLKRLTELLGREHDLAVLHDALRQLQPAPAWASELTRRALAQRQALRGKALRLAQGEFKRKPKALKLRFVG